MKSNEKRARSGMRIAVIAVAAALLLGTTAFAAGGYASGWFSALSVRYDDMPDTAQVCVDAGFTPVLPEKFENGYEYRSGHVDNTQIMDGELGQVGEFNSLMLKYEKDGDTVWLNEMKSGIAEVQGEFMEEYNGVELYFYSYTNKLVPADYELSEAEKAAQESGEIVFSFGASEVDVMEVCNLSWVDGGLNCSLLQMGGRLTANDLAEMAKEIIG